MTHTNQPAEPLPFRVCIRVRYAECDAQQVVFNARYGDYVDIAMTEYFRVISGGFQTLLEQGYDCQVVRMLTNWQAPARFDEVLNLDVTTERIGTTSFTLKVAISKAVGQQPVATSEVTYVLVATTDYKKTPLPDSLRTALNRGATGQLIDQSGSVSDSSRRVSL